MKLHDSHDSPARPELILSKAALPRHPRDTSLVRYGASHAALRGRGAPRQQKKRSDLETINDIYVWMAVRVPNNDA